MATNTFLMEDGELEFEDGGQWITSDFPEPDPNWKGADSNGHEHYYSEGPHRYPTLKQVAGDPYWCVDCRDEHVDTWFECPICGEQVVPGSRTARPVWVSTGSSYTWNGEPISRERANEIINAAARARDEACKLAERPAIGSRVRFGEDTVTVVPATEGAAADQVTVMRDGTGVMETVDLERLRKLSP